MRIAPKTYSFDLLERAVLRGALIYTRERLQARVNRMQHSDNRDAYLDEIATLSDLIETLRD